MATWRRVWLCAICFVFACHELTIAQDADLRGDANDNGPQFKYGKLSKSLLRRDGDGAMDAEKQPFNPQMHGAPNNAMFNAGGVAKDGLAAPKAKLPEVYNRVNPDNRINPNVKMGMNRGPAVGMGESSNFGKKRLSSPAKAPAMKLADSKECAADIKQYCSHSTSTNNFAILDCLQNDVKVQDHCYSF